MNLTEQAEIVTWPAIHYVFIEMIGPFQETAPRAWKEMHSLAPSLLEREIITGYLSLYKISPDTMTYRAGVALESAPTNLPTALHYGQFPGGKYSRFVLKGPYSDLPMACARVFAIVEETQLKRRDDFCIEHYVNDPRTTPEEALLTEILIPTL